jgi:hypothetical protein
METGHAAPNQYKYDSAPLYSAAVPQKELSQKTKQQSPQSFRFSFRSAFYIPFYPLLAARGEILQRLYHNSEYGKVRAVRLKNAIFDGRTALCKNA